MPTQGAVAKIETDGVSVALARQVGLRRRHLLKKIQKIRLCELPIFANLLLSSTTRNSMLKLLRQPHDSGLLTKSMEVLVTSPPAVVQLEVRLGSTFIKPSNVVICSLQAARALQ